MHRVIFILFSPIDTINNEQRGMEGGVAARPRAGLATVLSSLFGLATNTLNVKNNDIFFP